MVEKTRPSTTFAAEKEISSNVRNDPSEHPTNHSESFIRFGHQKVNGCRVVFTPISLKIHHDDPIFLLAFRVYCMCR